MEKTGYIDERDEGILDHCQMLASAGSGLHFTDMQEEGEHGKESVPEQKGLYTSVTHPRGVQGPVRVLNIWASLP